MTQPEEPKDDVEVKGKHGDDALARDKGEKKKKKKKSDKKLSKKKKLSTMLANESSANLDQGSKGLAESKPKKDKSKKSKKSKTSEAE